MALQYNGRPIINDINNRILRAPNAMPLKNDNACNDSGFAMSRQAYTQTSLTAPPTSNKKKFFCNRDASDVAARRRNVETGKGTVNLTNKPLSFSSTSDKQCQQRALTRVRNGGGPVAPPKVYNKYLNHLSAPKISNNMF
jgi:hypothetical protein